MIFHSEEVMIEKKYFKKYFRTKKGGTIKR